MSDHSVNEPLLDLFIFETTQLLEQLEQSILSCEQDSHYFTQEAIHEVFRIMHTIKSSAAMMMFGNISTLAHTMEDIFYYLREEKPEITDYSKLSDLVLDGVDFIKSEVDKIKSGESADMDPSTLVHKMEQFVKHLEENNVPNTQREGVGAKKQNCELNDIRYQTNRNIYRAVITFEEGCEMENVRAYTIIRNLENITDQIIYEPEDIIDNEDTVEIIRREGFRIYIGSDLSYDRMKDFLMETIFLKDLELIQLEDEEEILALHEDRLAKASEREKQLSVLTKDSKSDKDTGGKEYRTASSTQNIISVSVAKLDKLMDLVGEMVIQEAMVIQNPDLMDLELGNFRKAARQLSKITTELQDIVMSIRMVPLSATFNKMHRIVRDMCKRLEKDVKLEIIGDATEVDKNIIEHISDPLMHLVRNSIDHGIETSGERIVKGKQRMGLITLEAKNSGSDVLIIVKDDGKGLDKAKILKKAKENQLLIKNENDMTDREIFHLILLPGFSTNEQITEYSGRGVGMDVVAKNIEAVGGSLYVDSVPDKGTQITLKIPLTLAIIDGMNMKVGNSCFTIPMISIKQSFRPKECDIFCDTKNNEMIMVRGKCYPIIRLYQRFGLVTKVTSLTDGIIIMVEQAEQTICLFTDELLGQQQVVVKALPAYIQNYNTIRGISGCTLLGDGSISLIIDVAGLMNL